jgi:hypothetical protein
MLGRIARLQSLLSLEIRETKEALGSERFADVREPESKKPRCRICPVRVASLSPWVMLTIGDYCLPAILDTGSSFSFVR